MSMWKRLWRSTRGYNIFRVLLVLVHYLFSRKTLVYEWVHFHGEISVTISYNIQQIIKRDTRLYMAIRRIVIILLFVVTQLKYYIIVISVVNDILMTTVPVFYIIRDSSTAITKPYCRTDPFLYVTSEHNQLFMNDNDIILEENAHHDGMLYIITIILYNNYLGVIHLTRYPRTNLFDSISFTLY